MLYIKIQSVLMCTTSLQWIACLHFPTCLFYSTHKMLAMCKKLITFYAILFDICSLMSTACGLKHVAILSMTATCLRKNTAYFVGWILSIIYDKRNRMPSSHLSYVTTAIFGSSEQLNRQDISNTRVTHSPIFTSQPSKTKQNKVGQPTQPASLRYLSSTTSRHDSANDKTFTNNHFSF